MIGHNVISEQLSMFVSKTIGSFSCTNENECFHGVYFNNILVKMINVFQLYITIAIIVYDDIIACIIGVDILLFLELT